MAASTDGPVIRVVAARRREEAASSRDNAEHVRIGDTDWEVVYLQDDPSYRGCVKAYLMAEQQHVALTSYIARFEEVL